MPKPSKAKIFFGFLSLSIFAYGMQYWIALDAFLATAQETEGVIVDRHFLNRTVVYSVKGETFRTDCIPEIAGRFRARFGDSIRVIYDPFSPTTIQCDYHQTKGRGTPLAIMVSATLIFLFGVFPDFIKTKRRRKTRSKD